LNVTYLPLPQPPGAAAEADRAQYYGRHFDLKFVRATVVADIAILLL
jgi:hypothetical protein